MIVNSIIQKTKFVTHKRPTHHFVKLSSVECFRMPPVVLQFHTCSQFVSYHLPSMSSTIFSFFHFTLLFHFTESSGIVVNIIFCSRNKSSSSGFKHFLLSFTLNRTFSLLALSSHFISLFFPLLYFKTASALFSCLPLLPFRSSCFTSRKYVLLITFHKLFYHRYKLSRNIMFLLLKASLVIAF